MATKLKVNYEFVGDSTVPVTRTNSIKHGDKMLDTVVSGVVSGLGTAEVNIATQTSRIDEIEVLPQLIGGKSLDNYFGLCGHELSSTQASLYKEYGFNNFRIDITWSVVETTKGVYDFSSYDSIVNNALNNGMNVLLILDYNNTLYASDVGDVISTTENMNAFKAYVTACVSHFTSNKIEWEIWNEANYKYTAVEYYNLVANVYPLINGITVIGAIGNDGENARKWFDECCRLGILNYCDKVSIHIYDAPIPEISMFNALDYQSVIQKYANGKNIPIILSEFGYSTYSGVPNAPSDEKRGDYLIRLYMLGLIYGFDYMILYEATGYYISTNFEAYFGMFNAETLQPTQSATKLKTFINELKGYNFVSKLGTSQNIYVLLFTKNSDVKYVIWSEDKEINIKSQDGSNIAVSGTPIITEKRPEEIFELPMSTDSRIESLVRNKAGSKNIGLHSETFNDSNTATAAYSHAEGKGTTASGESSHSEGDGSTASGAQSHAEGFGTTASLSQSHSEGLRTIASGAQSHAEGDSSKAIGYQAHAEGYHCEANGSWTHAGGKDSVALGNASFVHGENCKTQNSHAASFGYNNATGRDGQLICGYNGKVMNDCLFVVGNGVDNVKKNAFEVTLDGEICIYSPSGYRFKLTVSDDGTLTTTM